MIFSKKYSNPIFKLTGINLIQERPDIASPILLKLQKKPTSFSFFKQKSHFCSNIAEFAHITEISKKPTRFSFLNEKIIFFISPNLPKQANFFGNIFMAKTFGDIAPPCMVMNHNLKKSACFPQKYLRTFITLSCIKRVQRFGSVEVGRS